MSYKTHTRVLLSAKEDAINNIFQIFIFKRTSREQAPAGKPLKAIRRIFGYFGKIDK